MSKTPQKLLWMDLEMTGLEPEEDRIIEVAAIVTDFEFKEVGSYEAIIKQPPSVLERMKNAAWYDWSSGNRKVMGSVYEMHTQSGLLEKIASEGRDELEIEQELIDFGTKHFDTAICLAGNSIHQDRRFIRRWWPRFEEILHYRMLDVTSFKIFMQGKHKIRFNHPDSHRAIEGIRGSIKELEYYLKKLQSKTE